MNNELYDLEITTNILLNALKNRDLKKGHEAVSILLSQGLTYYGGFDHPVMQQFFPVWSAIEQHIRLNNCDRALSQTKTWKKQLKEVIEMIEAAEK